MEIDFVSILSIAKSYDIIDAHYFQVSKSMHSSDEIFMREALLEAKKAYDDREVPVGAVLVLDGRIIARAHNGVEKENDATHHAELLCMQKGARVLNNWRLLNCTLYSTLEPCAMCAGAMILFRIKRLVYGAKDLRHGAIDILKKPHEIHSIEIVENICEEEAKELMQTFFRERRKERV